MQSGTTGINQIRIYSPEKQAIDQDPTGAFIRRWVPELAGLPEKKIAAPYRLTKDEQQKFGVILGQSYPDAIVEHVSAVRAAKERLYSVRRSQEARLESKSVFVRHGSRRGSMKSREGKMPKLADNSICLKIHETITSQGSVRGDWDHASRLARRAFMESLLKGFDEN